MRKTLLLISYLLFILSISLLGYKFVSANKEIPSTKSIIENQKEQEKYLTPYGYTIEKLKLELTKAQHREYKGRTEYYQMALNLLD